MGLQNLVGISLEQVAPVKETVKRLLDAAARHIADAKVQAISAETRFSSAYTASGRGSTGRGKTRVRPAGIDRG